MTRHFHCFTSRLFRRVKYWSKILSNTTFDNVLLSSVYKWSDSLLSKAKLYLKELSKNVKNEICDEYVISYLPRTKVSGIRSNFLHSVVWTPASWVHHDCSSKWPQTMTRFFLHVLRWKTSDPVNIWPILPHSEEPCPSRVSYCSASRFMNETNSCNPTSKYQSEINSPFSKHYGATAGFYLSTISQP